MAICSRCATRSRRSAELAFITRWHATMPDAERRERYSTYACHELHLFLYFKDRPFFDAVIDHRSLANKRVKTFLDHYLLDAELARRTSSPRSSRRWTPGGAARCSRSALSRRPTAAAAPARRISSRQLSCRPIRTTDTRIIDALIDASALDGDDQIAMAKEEAYESAKVMHAPRRRRWDGVCDGADGRRADAAPDAGRRPLAQRRGEADGEARERTRRHGRDVDVARRDGKRPRAPPRGSADVSRGGQDAGVGREQLVAPHAARVRHGDDRRQPAVARPRGAPRRTVPVALARPRDHELRRGDVRARCHRAAVRARCARDHRRGSPPRDRGRGQRARRHIPARRRRARRVRGRRSWSARTTCATTIAPTSWTASRSTSTSPVPPRDRRRLHVPDRARAEPDQLAPADRGAPCQIPRGSLAVGGNEGHSRRSTSCSNPTARTATSTRSTCRFPARARTSRCT